MSTIDTCPQCAGIMRGDASRCSDCGYRIAGMTLGCMAASANLAGGLLVMLIVSLGLDQLVRL